MTSDVVGDQPDDEPEDCHDGRLTRIVSTYLRDKARIRHEKLLIRSGLKAELDKRVGPSRLLVELAILAVVRLDGRSSSAVASIENEHSRLVCPCLPDAAV